MRGASALRDGAHEDGLCRTWQIVAGTPLVAATLGAAYALAGRAEEALPLVAGAVEEFRNRQILRSPALILWCAGMTCLRAGRIDEAALGHAGFYSVSAGGASA